MPRHAGLTVDLDAVRHNVAELRKAASDAQLCAVVKADGYGHGSVHVAEAALDAGASWLAVALVEEGQVLRDAGISAPILVLSEPPADAFVDAVEANLTPTVYTRRGIEAAAAAVTLTSQEPWSVHLKVDTGMHRVGADPADALTLAAEIHGSEQLELAGVFTHLATADEPSRPEAGDQLDLFEQVLSELEASGLTPPLRHCANSAATIAHPRARHDLVRTGIAIYGIDPMSEAGTAADLRPAMSLRADITLVKQLRSGDGVSYGLRYRFDDDATVAVVPLGYADGVPRRLSEVGGEVLVGGVRRPIRGVVTMDQLIIEVTEGPPAEVGDEVVLIGSQGEETITAAEWAQLLGTIPYEIVCGFGQRVPREYVSSSVV